MASSPPPKLNASLSRKAKARAQAQSQPKSPGQDVERERPRHWRWRKSQRHKDHPRPRHESPQTTTKAPPRSAKQSPNADKHLESPPVLRPPHPSPPKAAKVVRCLSTSDLTESYAQDFEESAAARKFRIRAGSIRGEDDSDIPPEVRTYSSIIDTPTAAPLVPQVDAYWQAEFSDDLHALRCRLDDLEISQSLQDILRQQLDTLHRRVNQLETSLYGYPRPVIQNAGPYYCAMPMAIGPAPSGA